MVFEWIIENKEFLKIVYALSISFICAVIVLKADRLFKISDYQGIRYFRNAFFFFGVAVIIRFVLGIVPVGNEEIYSKIIFFLFCFFTIIASLFLLYSLIWKKIESEKKYHSLFNTNTLFFYSLALVVSIINLLFNTLVIMFIFQIVLFFILMVISFNNYLSYGKNSSFLKYYFLTMVVGLVGWILNLSLYYFLDWNKTFQIILYGLNIIFFLIILYGTLKMEN
jgi:hypothetical protein